MNNCIFSGHCIKKVCDQSCPSLVESTYLFERNGIGMNSSVFNAEPTTLNKYVRLLTVAEGKLATVVDNNTTRAAEYLTYCGICQHYKGSNLRVPVYNLKFSQYIDGLQNSWTNKGANQDDIEYQKIWSSKAKVLIISNLDFVNFKDFQCQTLLTLLQSRNHPEFTTIIVAPGNDMGVSLVGTGNFFDILRRTLNESKIR